MEVQYSKYDIKRGIKLPKEITPELAYFCGLMAGDGHVSNGTIKHKYNITCSGNPADEKEFYDNQVKKLLNLIFNIDVNMKLIRGGKNNDGHTYGFVFGSKAIRSYLVNYIKIPCGNKYNSLKIPDLFKNNKLLKLKYIQGIVDTDFGFSLKKKYKDRGYYPVINFCSKSLSFLEEIFEELIRLEFKITKYTYKNKDPRVKKGYRVSHMFDINGHLELIKWISKIGFRHPKHFKKLEVWKENNKDNKNTKVIIIIKS